MCSVLLAYLEASEATVSYCPGQAHLSFAQDLMIFERTFGEGWGMGHGMRLPHPPPLHLNESHK